MIRRRCVSALLLALLASPAAAEPRESTAAPRRARPRARPRRPAQAATPPLPPPPPAPRGEPAPVPNNDVEAPRGDARNPRPQFNPTLIDPDDPQAATANDPNSLRAREDRLLRNPAPGARLRVPFSY